MIVMSDPMLPCFMKALKHEEVYLWDYRTVEDVKERIPYFLEEVYNQKRLHSALGYCPPNEFKGQWKATTNSTLSHTERSNFIQLTV